MTPARRITAGLLTAAVLTTLGGCSTDDRAAVGAAKPVVTAATAAPTTSAAPQTEPPTRLRLPTIDVDAPIDPVKTQSDGSQGVPDDPKRVGWWSPGARPGEDGSVALVGHTKSTGGGVFDQLDDLDPGDVVEVVSAARTWRYRVTEVQAVPVDQFDKFAADIYRTSGTPALTLMTCGDFDGNAFTSTVIVTAVEIPQS